MMLILGLKRQFARRVQCLSTPYRTQPTTQQTEAKGGGSRGRLALVPKQVPDSIWVIRLF